MRFVGAIDPDDHRFRVVAREKFWRCAGCGFESPPWAGSERFALCVRCQDEQQRRERVKIAAEVAAVEMARQSDECPECGCALLPRVNRRTGESFIGCRSYPACRYTRRLPSAPITQEQAA